MNFPTVSTSRPTWMARLRAYVVTHRVLRDVPALIVGIALPSITFSFNIDNQKAAAFGGMRNVIAVVVFVPLLLARRRWPAQVVVAGALAAAAITAASGARTAALPSVVVLLFAMSTRRPRRRSLTIGGGSVAAVFAAAAARLDGRWFTPDSFGILAWSCLALAAGDAVRTGRLYVESLQERTRQLESNQEFETKRRVVEERLRIARELHDVVAHNMAIVNVQAGVASHLLRTNPSAAEDALVVVRDAGRSVLEELSDLLSVLRGSDPTSADEDGPDCPSGGVSAAPEFPQPTLREIDPLVASFRAVGLRVSHHVSGERPKMPNTLQLTAYRIVEEALTNAHKHGDGNAELHVDYAPSAILLKVVNRIPSGRTITQTPTDSSFATSGYGLIGMHERVVALHGDMGAGLSTDGTFVLNVSLPIDRADRIESA
jgi:signal transduction histidine kinase